MARAIHEQFIATNVGEASLVVTRGRRDGSLPQSLLWNGQVRSRWYRTSERQWHFLELLERGRRIRLPANEDLNFTNIETHSFNVTIDNEIICESYCTLLKSKLQCSTNALAFSSCRTPHWVDDMFLSYGVTTTNNKTKVARWQQVYSHELQYIHNYHPLACRPTKRVLKAIYVDQASLFQSPISPNGLSQSVRQQQQRG